MKYILKIEECLMLLLALFAFYEYDLAWWKFFAFILLPDVGMVGYLFNARVGAITYNFTHHKGIAILIFILGSYFSNQPLLITGIILFAHSSLDRILGYGLKFSNNFSNTHLGIIGKNKSA